MSIRQKGFTLVELIVVIVILGILAATALPRFINVTTEARVSAVNGFAGGLRSAAAMAQARYFANGSNTVTPGHHGRYHNSRGYRRHRSSDICCRRDR